MDSAINRILNYTITVQQQGYEFLTRYNDPYNPIEIWVKKKINMRKNLKNYYKK